MNKCKYCGKETKNPKYCSLSCSNKGRDNSKYQNRVKIICPQCNTVFECRPSEIKQGRKFCRHSCAARNNNLKRESKYNNHNCLNCNKPISYIKYKKKFCNSECQCEYNYNEYIDKWKLGLESGLRGCSSVHIYIRKYMFNKFNNKCQKCGWNEIHQTTGLIPLAVHHKDGNWRDNTESNLELLCPNCHSLTETHGMLNKGNGRPDLRVR